MNRRQPPFTLSALQAAVAAGRKRLTKFTELCLLPRQYKELQNDIATRLGLELPSANSKIPVILCGVQLVVWRPCPNTQC